MDDVDRTAAGGADDPPWTSAVDRVRQRWQEPAPEMLTPDRLEKRRLADAMRAVIEVMVSTGAPAELVAEAADDLQAIADRFAGVPTDPAYEGYRETANVGDDPHASFELSPLIGRANPLAPPIELSQEGSTIVGLVTFGSAYEGPPGCVHGGYIAAAFDELLGASQSLGGSAGMTGTLTVRYRSPTPLHAPLVMRGWVREVTGRKIFADGTLHAGDRLCAEAEGIFISLDSELWQRLVAERQVAHGGDPGGDAPA